MRYYLTLILLTTWLALSAQQTTVRMSVSIPVTSLEAALKLVEQESHIPISYESSRLKGIQVKERVYKNVLLETILKELLAGTQLEYKEKGGNILIVPRPPRGGKTLSGFVEDAVSGEKLIGVSLLAPQRQAGTTTNNYGFYSITVPGDSIYILLSYTGYQRLDTVVSLNSNTHLNFKLQTASRELEQVTIRASRTMRIQQSSQMSSINLPVSLVRSMPRLLGEPDLMKTLQLMPGVKQGTEGSSALLVRGGTPDQNLVLLDGAPLYNPMHLLGIFSTFNTSVLKDVTLYKGAFPARFGGRLSSVVDISTKDGDMHQLHGDFSVGLLSSQLTLQGPLKKGKTSFVFSGRRTYPDLFVGPYARSKENGPDKIGLFFYDINAKLHHQFSDKDKLYFGFYMGRDNYRLKAKDVSSSTPDDYSISDVEIQWGNITSTLRWNHIFSPQLFANTMLIGSSYKLHSSYYSEDKYNTEVNSNLMRLNSGIRDYGVKTDFDYRPNPAHTIKMGASFLNHLFTPGTVRMRQTSDRSVTLDSSNNNQNINASEIDLYAEDDWEINSRLKLNAGLHWSGFAVEGRFYNSLQPRISMRYLLPGDWGLKASYTRMTQYIHLLAYNSISLPTDLWVPATKKIAPQQAEQYAIGLARNLFNNKYEFSVEGYYKKMKHVIEYKDGADYLTSSEEGSWQEQVAAGIGESYGVEVLMQKKTGRLTGWVGYTWATVNRTIKDINFGQTFPYKYDRRHDVHLVAVYKLRKNIEVSGSWTYQSPMPFTVPIARYERAVMPVTTNMPVYVSRTKPNIEFINSRNNVRVEPFHRLDLGISFIKQKKNGNVRTWSVSVLNAYNRLNPFYYTEARYSANSPQITFKGIAITPIIPSISYSLKF